MWNIHQASHFFVWLDVKPARGHRVVMQTFPGGIYSGMDYYISSSGLMMTETTLDQTRYDADGTPLATRARKALQYANSIDELVKELTVHNNGLYTNEWLIGDAKTNEIAVFEQGTTTSRLRRSSKKEWMVPGVEGFYWGCNNAKTLGVRLDTMAALDGKPEDASWRPTDRDLAWMKMYRDHRGKIDVNFGKLAYSAPPLAKLQSLDAKVTTSSLAKDMKAWALFGPPYGRVWEPEPWQKDKFKILRPLVPNEWTLLTTAVPGKADLVAADLKAKPARASATEPPTSPAWHGTLLPKTRRRCLADGRVRQMRAPGRARKCPAGTLGRQAERRRSRSTSAWPASANKRTTCRPKPPGRPGGTGPGETPPSPLDAELDRARWHREQTGYGALTLLALRDFLGDAPFAESARRFRPGQCRQGGHRPAVRRLGIRTIRQGRGRMAQSLGSDPKIDGAVFSTAQWLDEPESAVIVYGTAGDKPANREAALALQMAVARRHRLRPQRGHTGPLGYRSRRCQPARPPRGADRPAGDECRGQVALPRRCR